MEVVCQGSVVLARNYTISEFDEDDGWIGIKIPKGEYTFRVLNFRGWKPRQILLGDKWVDVAGEIPEVETAINS